MEIKRQEGEFKGGAIERESWAHVVRGGGKLQGVRAGKGGK